MATGTKIVGLALAFGNSTAAVPTDQRPSRTGSRCTLATRAVESSLEFLSCKVRHGAPRAARSKFLTPSDRGGLMAVVLVDSNVPFMVCQQVLVAPSWASNKTTWCVYSSTNTWRLLSTDHDVKRLRKLWPSSKGAPVGV